MVMRGSGIVQVASKLTTYGGRLADRADGFEVPEQGSTVRHKRVSFFASLPLAGD
jgi:hypothetical protein